MPEETNSIDYVMEKASGPHFSGLRLDGLLSSPPSSSTASPSHRSASASESNAPKQPFVIGIFHSLAHKFKLFNFNKILILFFEYFINFVGVSGGTASGKTTVCDMIIQQLHDHRVVLVNQVF
jgi:uridine kinase